ncbi:glycosyltransferase [Spirosoma sp. RP8]|uniref:Glycosyltransferase n=1 Tax=Spirosoma liriopis TaxID=2937440 RepID=A0ABT0HJF4_9BACT|nr:glycosyltransferase family 2 protein [Spirosoma liriopis]MCK8492301.1 glycosyltransferase [Spirosoma liriopis]
MEKNPLVSIIIVTYNSIKYIRNAIESVINQDGDYELIVIDGASNDGTLQIIKEYEPRLGYYISEHDKGIYDAMNKGVRNARGEWIYFLGSDDVLMPNILRQIQPLMINTKSVLLYGDVVYEDGQLFVSKMNSKILLHNTIHHQSAFYKRFLFDKFNYNSTLRIISDYELNLKIYSEKLLSEKFNIRVAKCLKGGSSYDIDLSLTETNLVRGNYLSVNANKFVSKLLSIKYFIRYVLLRKI